jgi:AraC-like DNA-binding protein
MERFTNLAIDHKLKSFIIDETQNPLIRLIDLFEEPIITRDTIQPGLYCIYISSAENQDTKLQFTTSEKLIEVFCKFPTLNAEGQVLIFHPKLIGGIPQEEGFNDDNLFNFGTQNSLPLLPIEFQSALHIFSNIKMELIYPLDIHSKRLIVSNLKLLLSYCERFFCRAVPTTSSHKKSVLQRVDNLLSRYFASENTNRSGIPSVAYCADELNLSANYFGALIKKESGKTAQEYIRYKLIEEATFKIMNTHKTINEIAYDFGFKYPQHFSRFFKRVVGQNPTEYRNVNRN